MSGGAPEISWSVRQKFRIVAGLLAHATGRLLDAGARDRALAAWLPPGLAYAAADRAPGCEYQVDLEASLPFADREFDHVVALDVLEHLEHPHRAFAELARVARGTLIVALPNFSCLRHRLSFLLRGRVATRKYDLVPAPDRHRWFTIYPEIRAFVAAAAGRAGWRICREVRELSGSRPGRLVAFGPARCGIISPSLAVERAIFLLERAS